MIGCLRGCLRTRVRKQPIVALCFEFGNGLKVYKLETWLFSTSQSQCYVIREYVKIEDCINEIIQMQQHCCHVDKMKEELCNLLTLLINWCTRAYFL